MFLTRKWIKFDEFGLVFKNGKFVKVIEEGKFWFFDLFNTIRVEIANQRSAWIVSNEIDQLALSDQLDGKAVFVDLKDNQRALIWIDGRFDKVLGPGLYGFWTQFRKVEVEVIDANDLRVARKDLEVILKNGSATSYLNITDIPEGKVGVLFVNGEFSETLPAGKQVFWKDVAKIKIVLIEERVKYIIWAADTDRAIAFYKSVLGAKVLKQNDAISELEICGSILGIHGGGEGERTWTGMSFQVSDVVQGADEVVSAGGQLINEPKPEGGEPPHLTMCVDTEGNQFMLTRKRA